MRMGRMEYVSSTDPAWLDVDVIHRFLSKESYWASRVPREVVVRSLANSLCFGAYTTEGDFKAAAKWDSPV